MVGVQQNKTKHLIMKDLSKKDLSKKDTVPVVFQFQPRHVAGVHLPSMFDKHNPVSFFKFFFYSDMLHMICRASNEYAELLKDIKPVMFKYYKT